MANPVSIRFGADIGDFQSSVAKASSQLKEFGDGGATSVGVLNASMLRLNETLTQAATSQSSLKDFASTVTAMATGVIVLKTAWDGVFGASSLQTTRAVASAAEEAAAQLRNMPSKGTSFINSLIPADDFDQKLKSATLGLVDFTQKVDAANASILAFKAQSAASAVAVQTAFAGNLTAVEAGFNYAAQGTAQFLAKLQQIPDVTAQMAAAMQSEITAIHNYSVPLEQLIIDVLPAFASASGEKLPEALSKLTKALDTPLASIQQFVAQLPNVTAAEIANAEAAARSGNANVAVGAIMATLAGRYAQTRGQLAQLVAEQRTFADTAALAAAAEAGLDIAADVTASKLEYETSLIAQNVQKWTDRTNALRSAAQTPEQVKFGSNQIIDQASPVSQQMDALQGKIEQVQRRIDGLNSDWQNFTTSKDGSSWNSDMEKATQTLATLQQQMTGLKAQAAGGTPTQLADLTNAQKDLQSGQNPLRDAQATLDALREQAKAATDVATKTQISTQAAQQELRVRQIELDLTKSQNALAKASSSGTDAQAGVAEARANAAAIAKVFEQGTQARIDADARVRAAQKAADQQSQQDQAAAAQSAYQIALNGFALRDALIKAEAATHKITAAQETAQLEAVETQRAAAETQLYQKLQTIWGEGTNQFRDAQNKIDQIASESAARRAKIEQENAKKTEQSFDQGFDTVTGQLNSAITSALSGQGRNAGRQFAQNLAMDVENSLLTSVETALKNAIMNSMGSSITSFLGSGGGNIFSAVFHMVGLPGFASGAWSLPSDMIAQVHAGEMIVPAGPAAALRGALSGNGGASDGGAPASVSATTHVNISAVDAAGVQRLFNANDGAMLKTLERAVRRGAHLSSMAYGRK